MKFNCCEMILSLGLTSSSCSQTSPSSLHQLQRPIYTGMIKLLKNSEEDQGMVISATRPGDTQHRLSSSSQGTQHCGHTWSCISPRTR